MAATYSSLVGLAVGGKYEVRRVLGIGGMGVVCEAVHLDLGKKVAVKLIDKTMKESELIVARFRREARAAGQIQSEHIVDVFDVGADKRVGLYMVMELLQGEDLQTRLEREGRVDVKTGVMLAHQMARGLHKAHAAGVVHRDLKPANVFLTARDNGQLLVKLLDFGVSKLLAEQGGARITGSGAPIGTPLYMAPEQAEGKDDIDGRADIWSLGAVVYEALAGAPPFTDRGSYHGTIVGILTSRPKLLHDAAPWVPPELARVVDAMLVHDRDLRIRDAEGVTQRLHEAFPAVMPDGTGRHTAVIVSQAAVDATGDTEFFQSFGSQRPSAPGSGRSSAPGSGRSSAPPGRPSAPGSGRPASERAMSTSEDSWPTIPRGRSDAQPSSSQTTRGSTPVSGSAEPDRDSSRGKPHRTQPIPWGSTPSSSAGGVAMPETPAVIDPLPPSELAPDTTRDDLLARRAERRRKATIAITALAILGVAVGGYMVGRRAPSAAPPVAASPHPTAGEPQPSPTFPGAATASVATAAAPSAAPDPPRDMERPGDAIAATPASALPSATEPPPRQKPRPPKARTAASAQATANAAAPGAASPEDDNQTEASAPPKTPEAKTAPVPPETAPVTSPPMVPPPVTGEGELP
jgi:eukaryotic-like serine/threonine-protein kinase